jgi:hypothetical protein
MLEPLAFRIIQLELAGQKVLVSTPLSNCEEATIRNSEVVAKVTADFRLRTLQLGKEARGVASPVASGNLEELLLRSQVRHFIDRMANDIHFAVALPSFNRPWVAFAREKDEFVLKSVDTRRILFKAR